MRNQAGFTLIELAITVAILSILFTVATPLFRGFYRNTEMDSFYQTMIFDLKRARSLSMAGDKGHRWGVHLVNAAEATDYYQVFSSPGAFDDPSTSIESIIYLPSPIVFTDPVPSSTVDIIFAGIKGTLPDPAGIEILNPVDNLKKTININAAGTIY